VPEADPDLVAVACTDNGIGFEPQYAERIFGVFQRLHTRDRYGGAGIGLSVCRKICGRHRGSIVAEGEPGVGARFVVRLPRRHRPDAM
jgi:light-regulated signal transduction histidine kinase (bacteriophytochrome)